jgi:uncharacterized protein
VSRRDRIVPVKEDPREIVVGVLSDTHGLLRDEAIEALRGSELILHAGDIGRPEIVDRLREVAPTVAVRGNVDTGAWASAFPTNRIVEIAGLRFHLLHALDDLGLDPVEAGIAAIVTGHSHRPSVRFRSGVLFLNPGSAGPRRFDLPVSVARVRVFAQGVGARILELRV